jgi:uncharacterized oxidoreductase
MRMTNNTILITGGTSGIGYEIARQLCENNTVIITGRNSDKLEKTKRKLKKVHTFQCDVAKPQEIIALHDQVSKMFPELNILINNAGMMKKIDLQEGKDLNTLTEEIETNLSGTIRMSMQFLPLLKKQRKAAIVNVSSLLAFAPIATTPVYCATKAAVHSYTKSLRIQLRDTNIKVFDLAPPAIETTMMDTFDAHEQKGMSLMGVSKLVKIAIKKMECNVLEIRPGLSNTVKIISRLSPNLALNILNK